jgi:transcriptional regulator with XRE-family HTH domain
MPRKKVAKDELSIFSQRLHSKREQRRLTQSDLVLKLNGTTKTTLSCYENIGKNETRYPSFTTVIELAEILDCSLEWLVGISNEDRPFPKLEDTPTPIETVIDRIDVETQYLLSAYHGVMLLFKTAEDAPHLIPRDEYAADMAYFMATYKKRCEAIRDIQEGQTIDERLFRPLLEDAIDKFKETVSKRQNTLSSDGTPYRHVTAL